MRETVICEPVRTPIGRYGGVFKSLTAVDLGVAALTGLLERTGLPRDAVDDVILGHCYPSMEAPAIGRVVALDAGLPSLEAVHLAGVELALRGAVHDALLLAHLASFGARLRVRQRRCGHADEGKDEGEHEVFHGAAS